MFGLEKKDMWVAAGGVSGVGSVYNLATYGFKGQYRFTIFSMGVVSAMCCYKATLPSKK